jgi:hypothetical protein
MIRPEHNSTIENVFTLTSQRTIEGESIESALSNYPEYAPELEPLLRLGSKISSLAAPTLSPQALDRITRHALGALEQDKPVALVVPIRPEIEPERRHSLIAGWASHLMRRMAPLAAARVGMGMLAIGFVVVLSALVALAVDEASEKGTSSVALEYYSGVITHMDGNEWVIDNGTQILIDPVTEIHGTPAVGVRMSCIAEQLPGVERYHALEVWIHPATDIPNVPPIKPSGAHAPPLAR